MDMDGDGILSMYELECFYTEQVEKMDALGIDVLSFGDCLCQVLSLNVFIFYPMTEASLLVLQYFVVVLKNYAVDCSAFLLHTLTMSCIGYLIAFSTLASLSVKVVCLLQVYSSMHQVLNIYRVLHYVCSEYAPSILYCISIT